MTENCPFLSHTGFPQKFAHEIAIRNATPGYSCAILNTHSRMHTIHVDRIPKLRCLKQTTWTNLRGKLHFYLHPPPLRKRKFNYCTTFNNTRHESSSAHSFSCLTLFNWMPILCHPSRWMDCTNYFCLAVWTNQLWKKFSLFTALRYREWRMMAPYGVGCTVLWGAIVIVWG